MKNKIVDLQITRFTKKGNGTGILKRENGPELEVEVPFSIPGDQVRAEIFKKRRGACTAKLLEILTPSSERLAETRCVHFAACGGCRWQQLSYESQLAHKQEMVKNLFKDVAPSVAVRPIFPSPKTWHYRNKMEFSFSSDASGKKYLGLIIDSSRGKVVNLTECHLVSPWFVSVLKAVRQWWHESDLESYHMSRDTGSLRTLTVREGQRSGDRMVMLTVSGNPDFALTRHHLDGFVAFVRDAVEPMDPNARLSIFLRIQQIAKGMETQFYEMLLHGSDTIRETLEIQTQADAPPHAITFTISPSAFFQPNSFQAERLYSTALQLAEIPQDSVVYDLYCGTGTLGICMAKRAKQVVGVEISPEAALDARTNAKNNGIDNYTVFTGPVHEILKQKELPKPDVVLVDPPRAGLEAAALQQIVALDAPKLVYISCNPVTQADNVADLMRMGYKLELLQPVDQFPQTVHIENIAILTK